MADIYLRAPWVASVNDHGRPRRVAAGKASSSVSSRRRRAVPESSRIARPCPIAAKVS